MFIYIIRRLRLLRQLLIINAEFNEIYVINVLKLIKSK